MRAALTDQTPKETAADTRDYPWLPSGLQPDSAPPKLLGGQPSILVRGSITGWFQSAKTEMLLFDNQ